jgi:membrane-associated phospholipid phosphatase
LRNPTLLTLLLAIATLGPGAAFAQTSWDQSPPPTAGGSVPEPNPPPPTLPEEQSAQESGIYTDIKLYYTAPLRWRAEEWAWFGGALLAIGASHHYDSQVRTHFVGNKTPTEIANASSYDFQDALPGAVVLLGTWGYASLVGDANGHSEAWAMAEAAGLSTVTAYVLKFAAGREGPNVTSDPNAWRKGGRSFPSEHVNAAFSIGTVLAESGGDDYRWVRRVLGYGVGVGTAYLRLEHNQHWLSDTFAGAALGIASAHFTMNRTYAQYRTGSLSVVPVQGGAMLTYHLTLP